VGWIISGSFSIGMIFFFSSTLGLELALGGGGHIFGK